MPADEPVASAAGGAEWHRVIADLSGLHSERLNDGAVLEEILVQCLASALGEAPTAWLRHEFKPQGVSLAGASPRARTVLHTWPELGAATLDIWTLGGDAAAAAELCACALGGRARHVVATPRSRTHSDRCAASKNAAT